MDLMKAKAPTARNGGALGFVKCIPATDDRDLAENLRDFQTEYVGRRTRLQPAVARVVVDLAFAARCA